MSFIRSSEEMRLPFHVSSYDADKPRARQRPATQPARPARCSRVLLSACILSSTFTVCNSFQSSFCRLACGTNLPSTTELMDRAIGASSNWPGLRPSMRAVKGAQAAFCSAGTADASEAGPEFKKSSVSRRQVVEGIAAGAMLGSSTAHLRASRHLSSSAPQRSARPEDSLFQVVPLFATNIEKEIAFWTRAMGMTVHASERSLLLSFSTAPRTKEVALELQEASFGQLGRRAHVFDIELCLRPTLLQDINRTGGTVVSKNPQEMELLSPSGQRVRVRPLTGSVLLAPAMRLAVA
mmetsp:Transcript_3758/g.7575  ORF Transcript_3758/g.7575 Transcript_3758/m.7575 type:complete len:295 (-) Transcript_3758:138-1022(-)